MATNEGDAVAATTAQDLASPEVVSDVIVNAVAERCDCAIDIVLRDAAKRRASGVRCQVLGDGEHAWKSALKKVFHGLEGRLVVRATRAGGTGKTAHVIDVGSNEVKVFISFPVSFARTCV